MGSIKNFNITDVITNIDIKPISIGSGFIRDNKVFITKLSGYDNIPLIGELSNGNDFDIKDSSGTTVLQAVDVNDQTFNIIDSNNNEIGVARR